MAQTVIRQPLPMKAWVQYQFSLWGFVVGKLAVEQALFIIVSFSCQYYSANAPHSFTDLLLKIYNLGN